MSEDKDYIEAQTKTILAQSKKISELERKLEDAELKLMKAEKQETVNNVLSLDTEGKNSDAETTCLVQLALIRGLAVNRELTLEEVKKLEILTKTLCLIRGKTSDEKKKDESTKKLSTADLLKLVDKELEQ